MTTKTVPFKKTAQPIWYVLAGIIAVNLGMGFMIGQIPGKRVSYTPEVFQQDQDPTGTFELLANKTQVSATGDEVTFTVKLTTNESRPYNVVVAAVEWNPTHFGFKNNSETRDNWTGTFLPVNNTSTDGLWRQRIFTHVASDPAEEGLFKMNAGQTSTFIQFTLVAKDPIANISNSMVRFYVPEDHTLPSIKFCEEMTGTECTNLATSKTVLATGKTSVTMNPTSAATAVPTAAPTTSPTTQPTATAVVTASPTTTSSPSPTAAAVTTRAYYELSATPTTNLEKNDEVTVKVKMGTTEVRPFGLAVAAVEWPEADFSLKAGSEVQGTTFEGMEKMGVTDVGSTNYKTRILTQFINAGDSPIKLASANTAYDYMTFKLVAKRNISTSTVRFYNPQNGLLAAKFCRELTGTVCTDAGDFAVIAGPNNRLAVALSGPGTTATASPTTVASASPIVTTSPTAAATIESSPAGGSEQFQVKVKLDDVNKAGLVLNMKVAIRLASTRQVLMNQTLAFTMDSSGSMISPVLQGTLGTEKVDVYVKGPLHWGERFEDITLTNGILDVSASALQPGDIPHTGGVQDGRVFLDDYEALVARIGSADAADLAMADLNYDGKINNQDKSMLLETMFTKVDEE